jgi:NitT/TauT family transport system substrate-binding protein
VPTVRLVGATGEAMAQGYYALRADLFAPAGVMVELNNLTNGGQTTAAVVSGAADVGITNIGSMANAHVRGVQFYLIAPSAVARDSGAPTTAITVLRDSPIRTARDLAGKTVAVSTLHDLQQAATMAWIDKNGGDSRAVSFVEIPVSTQVSALGTKRVDAAVLVEPFLVQAREQTRVIGTPYGALAPALLTHGWVANKGWYDANGPTVKKLLGAIRASAIWANRNPEATAQMLATLTKLDPDVIHRMGRLAFGETLDAGQIQPTIDASARYGFLPRAFPASELFAPG